VALDLAAESSPQEAAASLSGIAGDLAELERLTQDILTSAAPGAAFRQAAVARGPHPRFGPDRGRR
jgi:hypothetical protein